MADDYAEIEEEVSVMLMAIPHEMILRGIKIMKVPDNVKLPDDFPMTVYMGVRWCDTQIEFTALRPVPLFHWRMVLNP
jgi:hypothetical protein